MNYSIKLHLYLLLVLFLSLPGALFAQITVITGTIKDASTQKPITGVTVAFKETDQLTVTNNSGYYRLTTEKSVGKLSFSYIGYQPTVISISVGKQQVIDILLKPVTNQLAEIVVRSEKKKKYTNKDNPAVELIRQVIAHKNQNQQIRDELLEYQQYERMTFSLGNISDQFKGKRIFKNYQFLFRQQDSTNLGGKTLLPLFMEEKISKNYYRKSPYARKQILIASKKVKYDEHFIDNKGVSNYLNFMVQDINIYDNNISLLTNKLLSPIANSAPSAYKYFITDTLRDAQPKLIELSFTPRNTTDLLFEGKIYITMDGAFAVQGAVLSVNKNINLNFIRQMHADLTFRKMSDARFHLVRSNLQLDFGLNKNKGSGITGERLVTKDSLLIGQIRPDKIYSGAEEITLADAETRKEQFWEEQRPDSLDKSAYLIYKNIDSLQQMSSYRRALNMATLLFVGYKNLGPFEIGPVNTFYSFNPVEGLRLRLGGRTTTSLSKRYYFETYAAYGTRDEKLKYFLSTTYSLNNKSIYTFPQHYLRASYQHDTKIPGQELQFIQENNLLLSFKRGDNDQWLYNDVYKLEYIREFENHFSYTLGFKNWLQQPAGSLKFQSFQDGQLSNVTGIRTTELSLELRYAPHEKFYQGKLYRIPITDHYPVMTFRYNKGFKNLMGGDYNYQSFTGMVNKRFYLSRLGYTNVTVEGNYLAGQVPFPLLDIHRANQTYSLQLQSYNLMNFLEFVSDHYLSINAEHNFGGFLLNRVPGLKLLKWREIISIKALWGGIRNENNPAFTPSLLQFPQDAGGLPSTFTLNNGPYVEGSVGIGNIFKVLRIDLVKRFSYLGNPNSTEWGVRAMVKIDF